MIRIYCQQTANGRYGLHLFPGLTKPFFNFILLQAHPSFGKGRIYYGQVIYDAHRIFSILGPGNIKMVSSAE